MNNDIDVKPILKWVGGKRELVPQIREFYKDIRPNHYYELFFGGGAVYFDILKTYGLEFKDKSIINDINTDLIELYRNIKQDPNGIIDNCRILEQVYSEKDYYYIRDRFNGVLNPSTRSITRYKGIERSSSLILLNRTCFNGLYRVNSKGHFNVPKGNYKNPKIIDIENTLKLSQVLPPVDNILNKEFNSIQKIQKGDLVYFDPPYHPMNSSSSFTSYSGQFGIKEQTDLYNYFRDLDDKGVYVILSNSFTPFIQDLYKDFTQIEVKCSRNINSKSEGRGKISELLILGKTISQIQNIQN